MVSSDGLFTQDFADDNFPSSSERQYRRQAVRQAAENLALVLYAGDRLPKALNLVLANAVTINADGIAQVRSGQRTYTIPPAEGCPCEDAKRRTWFCKHYIAMLIAKRAAALLQGTQHASGQESSQESTATSASVSADWQVHEAPVACTLTFACKGEMYTSPCATFRTKPSSPVLSASCPKSRRKHKTPLEGDKSKLHWSLKISKTLFQDSGENHETNSR